MEESRPVDPARPALRVTLASRSKRRRDLLRRLLADFEVDPAEIDESKVVGPARDVVERLALLKASEVLRRTGGEAERHVLGADTVVALGDGRRERILGKPEDIEDARRMLGLLSGREHRVWTGLAVCRADREPQTVTEVTIVRFRPLSEADIEAYVATGEPLDKAGAYGIQGVGARLIEAIEGCYYNVVGLPLSLTASLLAPLVRADASLCDCAAHPLQRGDARCCTGRTD